VTKLYESQRRGVNHLSRALREYGAALDASDTGTGKTYVALGTAETLGLAPLVLCPKSVISSWHHVADDLSVPLLDAISYEKLRAGNTGYLSRVSKKKFVWELPPGSLVIFDEAHRCSGYDSQLSVICALSRAYRLKALLLSATIADNPLKMRAVGYLLGLHRYRDCYRWLLDNGCRKGFWGGLDPPSPKKLPGIMRRIHAMIFPERGWRMRSADMPEFPETLITAEAYEVEAPKKMDEVCRELMEMSAGTIALTEQLRLRQQVEYFKVPVFTELARDALDEGMSVAIFIAFRLTLDALNRNFPDAAVLHGDTPDTDRAEAIKSFQTNKNNLFLCTVGAGGSGVSLHDAAGGHPRMALISPTFNAMEMQQVLGRVHRAEGKSKSIQRLVYAAGTVEEHVARRLDAKFRGMQAFNDGDLSYEGAIVK